MASNGYGLNLTREMSYHSPVANSTLLLPLLLSLMQDPHTPYTTDFFQQEYDYIIVGGGTAGSALANRLSEETFVKVLLLEAGLHSPILTDVPAFDQVWWHTDIDWKYHTTSQKHAGYALAQNKIPFPAGKALGGTSIMNGALYIRGNHHNFDDWVKMGAKGWSYEEVLPYFKRSEDNKNINLVNNGYHSSGGLLSVDNSNYEPTVKRPIFEAADQFGYRIGDTNSETQTGFSDVQRTIRNQQRCSAAKAFLVPVEDRPNLDILVGAHVTKVVIEGDPLTATGVVFDYSGQRHTVKARKEVILSAGAINTPQILMLSGVGPKEELEKHNIPVLVDLHVGKNLMDHPASVMNYELDPSIPLFGESLGKSKNVLAYIYNRTGPLTITADIGNVAFIRGSEIRPAEDFPNCELYFVEGECTVFRDVYEFIPEVYDAYFKPNDKKPVLNCLSQLVQPKSRGTVTLSSTNPYDPPVIDPNYYADPQDLEDIVDGLKLCQKISRSEPLLKIGAKMFDQKFPGCEGYFANEDEYLRCIARYAVVTTSHQSGTTKMGDPQDPTVVVDPTLKVKGVQGLRVVDASIMPMVTSGNTMTPVYMIAEKAADMIQADMLGDYYPEAYTVVFNNQPSSENVDLR